MCTNVLQKIKLQLSTYNNMCTTENKPTDFCKKQLSKYFHLPINEAALQLGMCPSVLKKICRNIGIKRWPYRKIKSIDSLIESLQKYSEENSKIPKLNMDMNDLLEKKKYLLENPNVSYKSVVSKYRINSFRAQINTSIQIEKFEPKIKISTPIKKKSSKKLTPVCSIDDNEKEAANCLSTLSNASFNMELQEYINNSIKYARII